MGDEAGRVIQEADATLREWRTKLIDDEFLELGRDPNFTGSFLRALNHVRASLGTANDHPLATNAKRARANSLLDGMLGQSITYLSTLESEPRGSVDNTRHALDQLNSILKALADLPDFEGEAANVSPPPRPAPDTAVSSPPPPEPAALSSESKVHEASQTAPPEPPVTAEESAARLAPELTRAQLFDMLRTHFDMDELYALRLSLEIPAHALTTNSVASMARSLLEYAERHGEYPALVAEVKRLLPFLFQ